MNSVLILKFRLASVSLIRETPVPKILDLLPLTRSRLYLFPSEICSKYKYISTLIQWNSVGGKPPLVGQLLPFFFFPWQSFSTLLFSFFSFLFLSFPCACSESRFLLTIKLRIFNSEVRFNVEFSYIYVCKRRCSRLVIARGVLPYISYIGMCRPVG